ncbi:uncharacterized protein LOC116850472 [Odontomachus brunneus]|uniref:uncharacterized protein LOC116850472 n=1 Tax=Odontomachus brunneus TaxID=486640 RepID=UPI0013F228F4|nr:uncharacterized protein LOC116850472 [Odontomachus brunneus]
MQDMIKTLEKYVEQKGLEVNVEKIKVMRCRKGGGRQRKMVWRWKGKELEEVKVYKYLGYVVMANGEQRKHLEERINKGAIVMKEVWGIGKRKYGKDWSRRLWLFDRLVWSVVVYGVERIHDRFLKWVLGGGRCTPGYMVREETQREKLRKKLRGKRESRDEGVEL